MAQSSAASPNLGCKPQACYLPVHYFIEKINTNHKQTQNREFIILIESIQVDSNSSPSPHRLFHDRMYLRNIALFVAIYGRAALAALPSSCEDDGVVCPADGDKCITPLNSEYEPTGVGQVWFSRCCTVSKSSTADPSDTETESKKYCYNYLLKDYPSNQLHGIKPDCSENASGNDAWTLIGQCRTTGGVSSTLIYRYRCFVLFSSLSHPTNI